ncbi:hypothetical protein, partial [Actinoplanes lobatus]
ADSAARETADFSAREAVDFAAREVTADPAGAISGLEAGRSVLWAQLLELRADVRDRHPNLPPDLAARLNRVRRALDRPAA